MTQPRNAIHRLIFSLVCLASVVSGAATVAAQSDAAAKRQIFLGIPHSHAPWMAYVPTIVAAPDLANTARLDRLIRDGKLYLTLQDAITLALENNLDLEIARYNLPIAATDVQRTRAGGSFRGVNTGVVQNTPGAGFGSSSTGAGGTSGGAGGAGAGASGIVQSTLGTGTSISSYDPAISASGSMEHLTSPVVNEQFYGVTALKQNTTIGNINFRQAFATGTSIEFDFQNNRQTINSPYYNLTPALDSQYKFIVRQPLLAGFGIGTNLRYLRIAKNNQKISDIAFQAQIIATVTQIKNLYWDLFNAYQDEQVKDRSRQFAQLLADDSQKQFDLHAIPAMDVVRAQTVVASRDQDLTIAKTTLQLQELLMKNAITKNMDDSALVVMPVIPTEKMDVFDSPVTSSADVVANALAQRTDLAESQIELVNSQITRKSARNALLPTLDLITYYAGSGLAGQLNPHYSQGTNVSVVPVSYSGAVQHAFNNSSPDAYVGLELNIPIRNRIAKADQYRSELEYRQAQIRQQELRNQIRIEVQNAEYAVEQNRARVDSATHARDLAQKAFGIMQQEQKLGAGSSSQTLSAQHDLSVAESSLVTAMTAYQKARVELDRATGATLLRNNISIADARAGVIRNAH